MPPSPAAQENTLPSPRASETGRSPPRGPRADQRRLSRRRLIDAARALCAEGRFFGCSVSDIADKAELSRAGFYLHFRSKEDLLNAVMSEQLDWYVNQHNTMTEKRAASTEGIIGWLGQFVEGFRNAGELLVQFWMASPTREIVRQQQANRMKGVEALGHRIPALRMFRADGTVDPDRQRRVLLYTYQMEQACTTIAYGGDAEDAEATLRLLADNFQKLMRE
jgi:AcrR family transcriptional regulator